MQFSAQNLRVTIQFASYHGLHFSLFSLFFLNLRLVSGNIQKSAAQCQHEPNISESHFPNEH